MQRWRPLALLTWRQRGDARPQDRFGVARRRTYVARDMLIFRLVFGLLLLGCVLCFAMGVGTGDAVWRRRGVKILKWALIAAAGFFGVLILERLALML